MPDTWEKEYKKLLNKKDPLDKQILELTKEGRLNVRVVDLKDENGHPSEKYTRKSLPPKSKHTS